MRWIRRSTGYSIPALRGAANSTKLRVKQHTVEGTTYFHSEAAANEGATHPAVIAGFDLDDRLLVLIWPAARPYERIPVPFSMHPLTRCEHLLDIGAI